MGSSLDYHQNYGKKKTSRIHQHWQVTFSQATECQRKTSISLHRSSRSSRHRKGLLKHKITTRMEASWDTDCQAMVEPHACSLSFPDYIRRKQRPQYFKSNGSCSLLIECQRRTWIPQVEAFKIYQRCSGSQFLCIWLDPTWPMWPPTVKRHEEPVNMGIVENFLAPRTVAKAELLLKKASGQFVYLN